MRSDYCQCIHNFGRAMTYQCDHVVLDVNFQYYQPRAPNLNVTTITGEDISELPDSWQSLLTDDSSTSGGGFSLTDDAFSLVDQIADNFNFTETENETMITRSFDHLNTSHLIFMCIATFLGIPANLAVMVVSLVQFQRSQSEISQTCLIFNMALADVLTLVVAASVLVEHWSISYTTFTQQPWIQNFYCKLLHCGPTIFLTSSLFMITYIAFDRQRVLTGKALANRRSVKYKVTKVTLVSLTTWILAFLLCTPFIKVTSYDGTMSDRTCAMEWTGNDMNKCMDMCTIKNETEIGRQIELESHLRKVKACDYYYYDVESKAYMVNPSDSCGEQSKNEKIFWSVYISLGAMIPMLIIIYSYSSIIKFVRESQRSVMAVGSSSNDNRMRTLVLLFLFSASTAITWIPTITYRLIRVAESKNCEFFDDWAKAVIWISPVLNPILYSFMSKKFVRQFKVTCLFQKPEHRSQHSMASMLTSTSRVRERSTIRNPNVHSVCTTFEPHTQVDDKLLCSEA